MARRPLKLDADKLPLFEVEVSLAEGHSGLVLTPQHGAFTEASAALLSGLVDMCCSVERILENADLVEGVVGESDIEVATPMRDLILDDDFDEHKAMCLQLVDTSYDQVNDFVARYEPYRCAPHMRACTPVPVACRPLLLTVSLAVPVVPINALRILLSGTGRARGIFF